jgi:hypothetical protein
MYKVMAFISRKPGTTREEFRQYYEGSHAVLIGEILPPMMGYRRNYINLDEPFKRDEDQIDFDVVTEMLFATRDDCEGWFERFADPAVLARVQDDERQFLDTGRVRVAVVEVAETDYFKGWES